MLDLISRAMAKEAIRKKFSNISDRCEINEVLNSMPTVDAVPVIHGRPVWINPLDHGAKICMWKCSSLCSVCGDYVAADWKYCPNCGAKMDKEK